MKKLVCSLIACLNIAGVLAIPFYSVNSQDSLRNFSNSIIRAQHTLLHDQMVALSAEEAVPSQIFPDEPIFDCQAADDFIVPDGERWIIHEIVVPGLFSEPDVLLPIHGVLTYFNHVGASGQPETIPFFEIDLEFNLDADGNLVLFPPPIEFHPGHYWLSVQVIMPLSMGQWKWKKQQTPTILEEYHWRNPEPWIQASLIISDMITVDYNLSFSLFGDVLHPVEAVCPDDYHVCIDTPPLPLEGATPEGGVYEGPGVHGGMFFPLETGPGSFLIVYTYSNPFGAISTCDFHIHVAPSPIAYAGSNKSIIAGEQIAMHDAFTDHSDASEWTTSGDGFFDNPFNPQSTYIPGISDITDGEVELCITAQPIPPCTTPAADCMLLVIDPGDYPVIECSPDIVTTNDEGVCFASGIELDEPFVTDPYGITHLFNDAPSEYPVGETIVTWTAINAIGMMNTCNQSVVVLDNEDPLIEALTDMLAGSDPGVCGAYLFWDGPFVHDNCLLNNVSSNYSPGDFFPVGITEVIYQATDIHGNTSYEGFTVTVIDTEPPLLPPDWPPTDFILPNDPGQCGATATWDPPPFTDNCGEPFTLSNFQPGDFFPVGDTDVRYTATDVHGNTTMAGFRVTVIDVEPPEMHPGHPPPEDITIPNDPGHCGGTAHWEPPGFIDNCGEPGTQGSHQPGDFFPVGDTDVRYTATDMHGNTTMTGFRVTVIDVEPPEMHPGHPPPENIIQPNDQGSCGAIVTWTPPIFIDNCSDLTIVSNFQPGQFFPVGATEISYKATDSNENFMESSFIVEVYDATAPGIKCPPNLDLFVDDPPQPDPVFLTGAAPEGGTYEGNGVSNGYFNPYVAGIGVHSITYVYVNPESTCVYSCTFTIQVSPATGTIDKTETQELFKVYPNPNRGAFTITGPEKPALIEVIDMIGRTIWEQETSLPSNIVVTNTPKGMYFVKIVCDQRISIHKILIE